VGISKNGLGILGVKKLIIKKYSYPIICTCKYYTIYLGFAMLCATSDDMECGMWNLECGVMYKLEK
jgi:hypothetical protein